MNRLKSLLALSLLLFGGSAGAQTPPVITFGANGSLAQSQTLLAGGQVQVAYDASRLPQCRVTLPDGGPGWSLTGHYRLNGGAEGSFDVAGQPTMGAAPVLALPAEGTLEPWFRISSVGCEQYDSNYERTSASPCRRNQGANGSPRE
ncbi:MULTISPECIES: DUF6209 family protein [Myxococcus]|uniref:DUF6209 family protein n=1 Tax=Myxococcus TaxID=32 RepID=UPI0013D0AAB9|nr:MULTISPECIES: DUF6209 family protein [Myxococcus]NVJ28644.1 hypothetical protein [Myxococcus sp. AM011]